MEQFIDSKNRRSADNLNKNFKVFLDNEGVIHVVVLREEEEPAESVRVVELAGEELKEILRENPDRDFGVLVDLSSLGKITHFTAGARKKAAGLASLTQVKKMAICSRGLFLKVATNFVTLATGRSEKLKWFESKEKALGWLKEN